MKLEPTLVLTLIICRLSSSEIYFFLEKKTSVKYNPMYTKNFDIQTQRFKALTFIEVCCVA